MKVKVVMEVTTKVLLLGFCLSLAEGWISRNYGRRRSRISHQVGREIKQGFFSPLFCFFSFFLPCNELINSFRTELIYTH